MAQSPLVGQRVLIHGLQARPELEGRTGIAESFNPATGRYVVELPSGERIALRPDRVSAADGGAGFNDNHAANGMAGLADSRLLFAGIALAMMFLMGFNALSAAVLVGVGYMAYTALNTPPWIQGGVLGHRGNILERLCMVLHQATGMMVTPQHLGMAAALVLMLYWYFYHGPGSHGYGYGHGYRHEYGGYGGGLDFYWYFGAAMLGSYIWRMGGGGRPGGWSFDQLWHSLSNMDLFQGMMFLNLVQRVLGGGRRGGMGYRRPMYF